MRPKEDPHTRDCQGCDVAGCQRRAEEQGNRDERTKRTENLHTQDEARETDAKKAKEEVV